MDMRKFAQAFWRAEDLVPGQPVSVTINQVLNGRFDKPDVYFTDGSKMSLNATNARTLARAYGFNSDAWEGKEIELSRGETSYQGEVKATIIVQPISPKNAGATPTNSAEVPFDDDVPF
jgi:hypothetical protein